MAGGGRASDCLQDDKGAALCVARQFGAGQRLWAKDPISESEMRLREGAYNLSRLIMDESDCLRIPGP